MKKLEIQHLKGYLGTGLQVKLERLVYPKWTEIKEMTVELLYEYRHESYSVKSILRPLSDLKKYCDNLGFVPIEKLQERDNLEYLGWYQSTYAFRLDDKAVGILAMPHYIVEKLYEWHFDIHGLIEKGLAIDKNTLKL